LIPANNTVWFPNLNLSTDFLRAQVSNSAQQQWLLEVIGGMIFTEVVCGERWNTAALATAVVNNIQMLE
jgi:hypothetical protein